LAQQSKGLKKIQYSSIAHLLLIFLSRFDDIRLRGGNYANYQAIIWNTILPRGNARLSLWLLKSVRRLHG
jgi:hypothetical protein